MPTALISLGGGTNIFAGLKQSWTSVSWEQVVKADPQCIIINDYGTPTAAQKEKFLETSPITRNLTAVRNRCFLPLSYDEVTPGPRNAQPRSRSPAGCTPPRSACPPTAHDLATPVRTMSVVGIGARNAEHITVQAIRTLNAVNVVFMMDKGEDGPRTPRVPPGGLRRGTSRNPSCGS